jgi:hypothetical protein
MNICVGLNQVTNACNRLTGKCKKRCKFKQTKEEQEKAIQLSYERLRSLSYEEQSKISVKYYDSKMPWHREDKP